MSNKMTCPGCNAYLSSVRMAFEEGEPCPECGLSASAAIEVEAVRARRGDEKLQEQLAAALIRADSNGIWLWKWQPRYAPGDLCAKFDEWDHRSDHGTKRWTACTERKPTKLADLPRGM